MQKEIEEINNRYVFSFEMECAAVGYEGLAKAYDVIAEKADKEARVLELVFFCNHGFYPEDLRDDEILERVDCTG